jgi:hypothetical protein
MTDRAELLERHVSSDGALIWRVEREPEPDGTISFGFEGADWHLHPDDFEPEGRTLEQIARDVTADVIENRVIIVTLHENGKIDRYLLETVELELELNGTYADLAFRFWSGRRIERAELLEGSVDYKPLGQILYTRPPAAPSAGQC